MTKYNFNGPNPHQQFERKPEPQKKRMRGSPTPPPLPTNLPPLPESPLIVSYPPNSQYPESTVLVLSQDPPVSPHSSSSSSPLSTSELLKVIKSSQVDLKKSLGMIESIVDRTNQVQRMCEALKKSPTRKSDPTALNPLPPLSNIEVVGHTDGRSDDLIDDCIDDYSDNDDGKEVVDEINRSFIATTTAPSAGQGKSVSSVKSEE